MIYTAKNLEDIAQMFDLRASNNRQSAQSATTQREKAAREAASAAWEDAAHVLRHTKLTG